MGDGRGGSMPFSRMEKVVLITSSIIFSLFFVYLFYRVSGVLTWPPFRLVQRHLGSRTLLIKSQLLQKSERCPNTLHEAPTQKYDLRGLSWCI